MKSYRTFFTLSLTAFLVAYIAGCADATTEATADFEESYLPSGIIRVQVSLETSALDTCETCRECPVTPITHSDLSSGSVDPEEVGDYQYSSGKLDGDRKRGGTVGPITWTTDPTGTYVSWSVSSPHDGIAIVMKGGPRANVYVYGEECRYGTRLVCPTNSSGGPAQLSNITFYWNECPGDC